MHKLDKAKDPNFWSVRVSSDIRLIVHKTETSLLLCYVNHHDPAYRWAERRKLETHPKTGAVQLVEVREMVKEITVPKYVEIEQPAPTKPLLFTDVSDDDLLSYGVPPEWLEDARQANEDTLLELTVCSLRATSVSGYSRRPFRGGRWVLISVAGPERCGSTTGHPTRFVVRRIDYCHRSFPMSMATRKSARARSRSSTDRSH